MFRKNSLKIDYFILFLVLVLVVVGTLVVYSASYYELEIGFRDPPDYHFKAMAQYAAVGVVLMLVVSFIPYRMVKKIVPYFFVIAILAQFSVFFFGIENYGAMRWIKIGGFTFMPSELAKLSIILVIAWFADKAGPNLKRFSVFLFLMGVLLSMLLIVVPQKDLATMIIMFALSMCLLLIAGAKMLHLFTIAGFGSLGAFFLVLLESYRGTRMKIWVDTIFDRNYLFSDQKRQIMNSIYAISSGGIRGKGPGFSEFSNFRLSEAYSDFIFAIFSEEFGFLGSLILLILYAVLIYRIFKVAMDCKDMFGFIVTAGTGLLIGFHVIISVGVALALLPTTGITLPFISKGGTSLVSLLLMMGIVLNISSKNKENDGETE